MFHPPPQLRVLRDTGTTAWCPGFASIYWTLTWAEETTWDESNLYRAQPISETPMLAQKKGEPGAPISPCSYVPKQRARPTGLQSPPCAAARRCRRSPRAFSSRRYDPGGSLSTGSLKPKGTIAFPAFASWAAPPLSIFFSPVLRSTTSIWIANFGRVGAGEKRVIDLHVEPSTIALLELVAPRRDEFQALGH